MIPAMLALVASMAVGTAEPTAHLLGFDALQRQLGEPQMRFLDARPRPEYDAGHIPGAVWVDVKAAEALAARPGGLTDRAAWAAWAAPLGIAVGTEVYVYDARRQLDAARTWWLISHLGVAHVGLVDGGFPLWSKERRPIVAEVPKVKPSTFEVAIRDDRRADRADVLAAIKGQSSIVVDARTLDEHTGAKKLAAHGGRVPTACHLEWSTLVDADGRFLDQAALEAKVAKLGIGAHKPVITHCQGGGRASVDAWVFERLGHPTRNYYLGWSDWGNAEEMPFEVTPRGKP